jgi:hypothetical protein
MDYPGSGDRTARDVKADGEVTLMFTSFTDNAKILRLYCKAELIEKGSGGFSDAVKMFVPENPQSIRRFIKYRAYAVESSCGKSTPYMEYIGERRGIIDWAEKLSSNGMLDKYVKDHETPPDLRNI